MMVHVCEECGSVRTYVYSVCTYVYSVCTYVYSVCTNVSASYHSIHMYVLHIIPVNADHCDWRGDLGIGEYLNLHSILSVPPPPSRHSPSCIPMCMHRNTYVYTCNISAQYNLLSKYPG